MFEQLKQWLGSEERATYAIWILLGLGALVALYLLIAIIRALMRGRLNISRSDRRNRPPRLGVTDFFDIDREGRRLVIVRRDNVEHLIMIGGPNNDVLIESNIVRGVRTELTANGDGAVRPTIAVRQPESIDAPMPPPAPQPVVPPPAPPRPLAQATQVAPPPVLRPSPPPAPAQAAPVNAPLSRPAPPAAGAPSNQQAPQRVEPPMGAPQRPAAASALNAVTDRLNANLKTIIPPTKIGAKPADPLPQRATAEGGNGDLEQEMARLLGKPGGGS